MNFAKAAENPATLHTIPFASAQPVALNRLPFYIACTALALAANYLLGKDLPWDTLNYQLYAGFSGVNDRLAQDYFAAGPPTYFNPYAYVPFYALVRAGLSPLEISSLLAVVHSFIFWLIFEIALCVCPSDDRRVHMTYGVCAVALAFVNPILVQQIGSSFADITTAELVLAGWLLLARSVSAPNTIRVVGGGFLLGVAVALKLTNAVHAIAGFAVLILLPLPLLDRIRHWLAYAASLGIGFAVAATPWSYRLERMFGNPLFPLMNNVFRSPEFTTAPLRHFRFIPESLPKALLRPFAIADPVPMVQEELTAPDLRYAVLLVLTCALFLYWVWRRLKRSSPPATHSEAVPAARVLMALACGFTLDWVLWLKASGNGRYFLPMASVTAVMIVALLFRLSATRPKIRNYLFVTILGVQIVQLCVGANLRWDAVPWDERWLSIEVPHKLAVEANLYLTLGVQSNSFIAPFLASSSGLVNFSGGYALGPEGVNGARIRALIERYSPHLRVLWRGSHLQSDFTSSETRRLPVDDALSRFGLRVDTTDCVQIVVHGLPPEPEITYETTTSRKPIDRHANYTTYLNSCRLVRDLADHADEIARQREIDLVFGHLESACPALFQPTGLRSERTGEVWRRLYVNTDLVAMVYRGNVRFINPVRGGPPTDLGHESAWAKAPLRLDCGRRDGHYYANVLKFAE